MSNVEKKLITVQIRLLNQPAVFHISGYDVDLINKAIYELSSAGNVSQENKIMYDLVGSENIFLLTWLPIDRYSKEELSIMETPKEYILKLKL